MLQAADQVTRFLQDSASPLELRQEARAQSDLSFRVDPDSGLPFFQVVDVATRKVIRQIPSEEVLAMARRLKEAARDKSPAGWLMNHEV